MKSMRRPIVHLIFFLISLIGLFFLFETGEHGAKLVFNYGLGTGQVTMSKAKETMEPKTPGFHQGADGEITWIAGSAAKDTLGKYFNFLKGDANSLNAVKTKASPNKGKSLIIQNPDFFLVTPNKSYTDVQIKISINPDKYTGDIILAHNVHDADNYACMILHPDGSASLAQYKNGKSSTVAKEEIGAEKIRHLTLTVSGKHIHGAVNGKEILHGHSDQTGPGAIGLKLDGNGTLGLRDLKITPIPSKEHHHEEKKE